MKPINRRYHNLDDPTMQPSITWDMSNGSEIVVHDLATYGEVGDGKIELTDLATYGEVGDGKIELTALAQAVCDAYEETI